MASIGIYQLIHRPSGYFYIGSSGDLNRRKWNHLSLLKSGTHPIKKLQVLYNENPEIDWVVTPSSTREQAYLIELALIKQCDGNPLRLNVVTLPRGGSLPASVDPSRSERDAKTSRGLRGKKLSVEHKASISAGKMGGHHSDETKALMSSQRKGRDNSWNWRAIIIDGVHYPSARHASESLGLPAGTINARVNSKSPQFANWVVAVKE